MQSVYDAMRSSIRTHPKEWAVGWASSGRRPREEDHFVGRRTASFFLNFVDSFSHRLRPQLRVQVVDLRRVDMRVISPQNRVEGHVLAEVAHPPRAQTKANDASKNYSTNDSIRSCHGPVGADVRERVGGGIVVTATFADAQHVALHDLLDPFTSRFL